MKNISVFPSLLISAVFALGWTTESANAAAVDSDGDGVNDYREDKDGTDRQDPNSFNPLSKGLVAYYPFDGNANDESGYGKNGLIAGSGIQSSHDRNTTPNKALSFAGGNSDYVSVMPTPLDVTQNFSISFWCFGNPAGNGTYANGTGQDRVDNIIATDLDGSGGLNIRYVSFQSPRWQILGGWRLFDSVLGTEQPQYVSHWNQVVVTRSNLSLKVFLNGYPQAEQELLRPIADTGALIFGRHRIGESPEGAYPLTGTLDEVRMYNRPLSPTEVKQLFQIESDPDKDGLTSDMEAESGTNPNNPDTDNDGLKDGAEYLLTDLDFDPLVPNGELMDSLFVPSFYPSIEIFAPASTALKISLGGADTVSTNSVPSGWVFNANTKQMSGVLSGITSSSGQMTAGKTNGLNLPVTFNFHPQNRQSIGRFDRISSRRVSAPPFVVLPPIASSGLPVTLSVKSGPATISSNNVITITGIGTVVIAANQPGSNNFLPAPEVTTSFRVTP